MIIVKIIGVILLAVFMLGMLGGMGLLGMANSLKKQFKNMQNGFGEDETQQTTTTQMETGDVDLEECPKCGTYTEKNNHCEACGHSW